jgi:hypothetical protein
MQALASEYFFHPIALVQEDDEIDLARVRAYRTGWRGEPTSSQVDARRESKIRRSVRVDV